MGDRDNRVLLQDSNASAIPNPAALPHHVDSPWCPVRWALDTADTPGQDGAGQHLHGQVDVELCRELPEILGPDEQGSNVRGAGLDDPVPVQGQRLALLS